jgi:hypothetical protein
MNDLLCELKEYALMTSSPLLYSELEAKGLCSHSLKAAA